MPPGSLAIQGLEAQVECQPAQLANVLRSPQLDEHVHAPLTQKDLPPGSGKRRSRVVQNHEVPDTVSGRDLACSRPLMHGQMHAGSHGGPATCALHGVLTQHCLSERSRGERHVG